MILNRQNILLVCFGDFLYSDILKKKNKNMNVKMYLHILVVKNDYKVWNYEYNKGRRTKNKFLKIWETNKNIF